MDPFSVRIHPPPPPHGALARLGEGNPIIYHPNKKKKINDETITGETKYIWHGRVSHGYGEGICWKEKG